MKKTLFIQNNIGTYLLFKLKQEDMKEISSLPSRRMTTVEVAALQSSSNIIDAEPHFVDVTQPEDEEEVVIGVTIVFVSESVSIVCYDPERNRWMQMLSEDVTSIDAIDTELDATFEWMTERYGEEGYATVGKL